MERVVRGRKAVGAAEVIDGSAKDEVCCDEMQLFWNEKLEDDHIQHIV
jgi:hypothetical protein